MPHISSIPEPNNPLQAGAGDVFLKNNTFKKWQK